MTDLNAPALAVLRVLADRDDTGGDRLTLATVAARAGLSDNAKARYALLLLSDRRLIDGHGSGRRLTDAGRAVLAAVREADAAGEPLPARVVVALEAEVVTAWA